MKKLLIAILLLVVSPSFGFFIEDFNVSTDAVSVTWGNSYDTEKTTATVFVRKEVVQTWTTGTITFLGNNRYTTQFTDLDVGTRYFILFPNCSYRPPYEEEGKDALRSFRTLIPEPADLITNINYKCIARAISIDDTSFLNYFLEKIDDSAITQEAKNTLKNFFKDVFLKYDTADLKAWHLMEDVDDLGLTAGIVTAARNEMISLSQKTVRVKLYSWLWSSVLHADELKSFNGETVTVKDEGNVDRVIPERNFWRAIKDKYGF